MRNIVVIPFDSSCNQAIQTYRFAKNKYVGSVVNVAKQFSDLGADEIFIFDINSKLRTPDLSTIKDIAKVVNCPLGYGGGISSAPFDIYAPHIFKFGVEKIVLCGAVRIEPTLVGRLSSKFGQQSIVVCLQYKDNHIGVLKKKIKDFENKCGEFLLIDVMKNGTREGLNPDLLALTKYTDRPVIVSGGWNGERIIGCDAIAASTYYTMYRNEVMLHYERNNDPSL